MKTFKLHITGKVQGVWYRASAKDKAIALGLTGKIWNDTDGNVGAIVRGPVDKVQEFIEWCKKGPPLASVEKVSYEALEENITFEDFSIGREA